MGFISNILILSACFLVAHYGTVYAENYCNRGPFDIINYQCPDDKWCCGDDDEHRCCSYTSDSLDFSNSAFYSFMTTALVAFAVISCCCLLCSCCCRRRRNGVVYSSGVSNIAVTLPPQSVPQGYPGYPSVQPPYPPNAGYNPYYGAPPPEYQPSVPTPVSNPHSPPHTVTVVPVASAPPAM